MNKVLNINLGGYAFTIDEDAFAALNQYLQTLRTHFQHSDGCEEIMSDIESRMAELVQEKLNGRPIVDAKNVQAAISVMGTPEDFGAANHEPSSDATQEADSKGQQKEYSTGKRLFRDPENKVVGGVCAGIAAYFGIADPFWVRLGFAAAFFTFGVGGPLYILLMLIMPKAKTASDRLAMRGEPVNASNIAKIIDEGVGNLSQKISEFSEEFTGKNPANKTYGNKFRQTTEESFSTIGDAILTAFHSVGSVLRPVVIVVGAILVLALAAFWISLMVGFFYSMPVVQYIIGSRALSFLTLFNMAVLVGVPVSALVLRFVRLFVPIQFNNYWWAGLGGFWLVNLLSLGLMSFSVARNFRGNTSDTQEIRLENMTSDTLNLNVLESSNARFSFFKFGDLHIDEDSLTDMDVSLRIVKSVDKNFRLTQTNSARSASSQDAYQLIRQIDYRSTFSGNTLTLPDGFGIPKGGKYRVQKVDLVLEVPDGKYVRLGQGSSRILKELEQDFGEQPDDEYENHIWKMTAAGFSSPDWVRKNNSEQLTEYKDFTKIQTVGQMKVIIQRGERFEVKLSGHQGDIAKEVHINKVGDLLRIRYDSDGWRRSVTLHVTMPELEDLDADDAQDISIEGFKQEKMRLSFKGDFTVNAVVDVQKLILDQTNSTVELRGSAKNFEVSLVDNAKLDADHFEAKNAVFEGEDGCEASLNVSEKLTKNKDDARLKVRGNPSVKKTDGDL